MKLALLTTDNREPGRCYAEPHPMMPPSTDSHLQGFARMPDLEVHVISCLQQPVQSPEKLADNIFFHALHVPKIGWLRTGYQGCVRAVRRKLHEIQPDIVHAEGTERDAALSAVFSGFPNVVTIHGNMRAVAKVNHASPFSFLWLAAKLEAFTLPRTDGVLCNSAYTEDLVAPKAIRTWRIPNALRMEFFDQPPSAPDAGLPILLNVGGLSGYKRQTEILAVTHKLWERGLRFEMQFAGQTGTQSDYGANFMRQLAEAESIGFARHIGMLNLDALIAAFDRASALVHFPCEESFGLVVAEALARNRKLFASEVGGIVDISSGDCTELFGMEDWEGLEDGIANWMENGCPQPTEATDSMRERFHPKVIANRHLEIYREALAKNNMRLSKQPA